MEIILIVYFFGVRIHDELPTIISYNGSKGISSYRLMKLGFPRSTYYAMKHGDNISSHTVDQLCRILKCNVSDIMEYVEDETEDAT